MTLSSPFIGLDTKRTMSAADEEIVADSLREFNQLQLWRNTFASQWEEASELIYPNFRNTFFYGNMNWPGQKKTDRQIDASGMMALKRFGAICDSLLTPRNSIWHTVVADDDDLMKQRPVALYFEQVTKILFKHRYDEYANFTSQNQSNYQQLGAFGNHCMFIDQFDYSAMTDPYRGIRYKSVPLGEMFWRENHQGLIDGFIRWVKLSARQCLQKVGPENFPATLKPALDNNSEMLFNFIHRVVPRADRDPYRRDSKSMAYASYFINLEQRALLTESGYRMLPIAPGRYDQAANEIYGRGPAQDVLPALKTLNAQKAVFLKQGHRASDPVLLTADDGIIDADLRPGAVNKGGVSAEGKELIKILPTGNIQINEKMMEAEQKLINDAFLVSLFQIMTENPQMTATEVIERTNEKGILLAPTVGRQQSEYLGPMIGRELDVLAHQGLLPPTPPELKEAGGKFKVGYSSPLAKAMRAQEAAGFIRTVESVKELVNITQDMSLLDPFDFNAAAVGIADIQSVPPSWMASPEAIQQKAQARAEQQKKQEAIQAAPAQAAMMKAQAAVQKANPGGAQGAQAPAQPGAPLAQQMTGQ